MDGIITVGIITVGIIMVGIMAAIITIMAVTGDLADATFGRASSAELSEGRCIVQWRVPTTPTR